MPNPVKPLSMQSVSHPITIAQIIKLFGLQTHPEGGYFSEPYRATGLIPTSALAAGFSGPRSYATVAYFLLPEGHRSRLHRIKSDEIWHFYLGGPLTLVEIDEQGTVHKTILGHDLLAGQSVHYLVKPGRWFGAYPNPGTPFSFVGLTVTPGFDFSDLEMAERHDLLRQFPNAAEIILSLTP